MLINQASKITGLTKKAIEYYIERQLVSPRTLENGYRDFSDSDVEKLKKIALFRKLDIGTKDIVSLLYDESNEFLKKLSIQKELDIEVEKAKKSIFNKLSTGSSFCEIEDELRVIEDKKTITEKLLDAFPGYYGRFICLHFARFLNEPIEIEEQKLAYKDILSFFDETPNLEFPEELKNYLIENTKNIDTNQIKEMIENTRKSIENPETFLEENKEILDQYLAYKQSDEYKNSSAYKMMLLLKEFNRSSGYYDIFIPALRKLSSSYDEYYKQLERANEKLLAKYPEIENIEGSLES